jgi:hypothetical protein
VGSLNSAHIHGTDVPVEEPSTASNSDVDTHNWDVGFTPHERTSAAGPLRSEKCQLQTLCTEREDMNFGFFVQQLAEFSQCAQRVVP